MGQFICSDFAATRRFSFIAVSLTALSILAGCASAEVNVNRPYMGGKLAKPSRILVYDFSSNFSDLPANSPLRKDLSGFSVPQTAHASEVSRKLGAEISSKLAADIRAMGLPAVKALAATQPRAGDFVLKGFFMSLDEGSAAKRVGLGFGSGAAELKVAVEAYQMTAEGLRFIGSGEGEAGSGKTPGTALSLGVAVATANPVGLIVSGAAKAAGEYSGKETIEGAANRITKLVSERLKTAFERHGWI